MNLSILGVLLLLSMGAMAQTPQGEFVTNFDSTITVNRPRVLMDFKSYPLSTTGRYSSEIIDQDELCHWFGLGDALHSFKSKTIKHLGTQKSGEYHHTAVVSGGEILTKEVRNDFVFETLTCLPKKNVSVVGLPYSAKKNLPKGLVSFENPRFKDTNQYIHFDVNSSGDGVCRALGMNHEIRHSASRLTSLSDGAIVDEQGERLIDKKVQLYTLHAISSIVCE